MRTLLNFFIAIFISLLSLPNVVISSTTGDMLSESIAPRAIALGGAYTASAEDVHTVLYNPAGLAGLDKLQFEFLYHMGIIDSKQYVGVARPIKIGGSLGIGVLYRDMPSIDNSGAEDDPVVSNDTMVVLSYARMFEKINLSAGFNFKWLRSVLGSYEAAAVACDFGVVWEPLALSGGRIGMAVQNLGMPLKYIEAEDDLPLSVKLGMAYKILNMTNHELDLMLDLSVPLDTENLSISIGSEYWAGKILAFRAGYQYQKESLASTIYAGVGVKYTINKMTLKLDYALKPVNFSPDTMEIEHLIALILDF